MKTANIIIIILAIGISIISIHSIDQHNNTIEFFTSYTIATNYIDLVIQKQKITEINCKYYNDYIYQPEGYIYDIASVYLDDSLSLLKSTKEDLMKSKNRLLAVQNSSPNEFYSKEINLRLLQVDSLLTISEKRIQMINLSNEILYKVNYVNEIKEGEYVDELNLLIEEFNLDIEKSIEVENNIDIHWLEDFYPN